MLVRRRGGAVLIHVPCCTQGRRDGDREEAHRPPDMKVENPVGQRGNDLEEEVVTVAVMEARLEAARPDLAREFEEKLASMAPGTRSGGELLTAKVSRQLIWRGVSAGQTAV